MSSKRVRQAALSTPFNRMPCVRPIGGPGHRSWRLAGCAAEGPWVRSRARWVSPVDGEESDAGKGHLDRGRHVVDVATRLGQDVAALQGGDQTGGQLIGSGVAAELTT